VAEVVDERVDVAALEAVVEQSVGDLRRTAYSMGRDPSRYGFLSAAKKAEKLLEALRTLPRG
jgi:hypothetical protein